MYEGRKVNNDCLITNVWQLNFLGFFFHKEKAILLQRTTDCYYKVHQVLQSETDCSYKVRQVLQSVTEFITKCIRY